MGGSKIEPNWTVQLTNWHNGQEEKLNLKVPNYALFIRKTNLPFYKHFGLCVKPFPASCPQQLWWGLSFSEFNHVSLGKCCWSITTKEFDEIRKQIESENEDSPFVLWNDESCVGSLDWPGAIVELLPELLNRLFPALNNNGYRMEKWPFLMLTSIYF